MVGDSIIFLVGLGVILMFSKHLSRTSFAVISLLFLLTHPQRDSPAPSLLEQLFRNLQPQKSQSFPWKSHFFQSWDCSHYPGGTEIFSPFQQDPLSVLGALISVFCCCQESPQGKFPFTAPAPCWELLSLHKLLKLLGFFCTKICSSASAGEAGSSCPTSRFVFRSSAC